MSLTIGTRVGPYEVTGTLGAGGMGEVYRARDTKLGRDVALKVLPEQFASDPDRLARFKREAQVLASLNHPNIAAIYGLEETGSVRALVLELVEGPTLADRIARGPLPLEEALGIARQIADALEASHEVGVVHRDLKPANTKVRADGTVKVLDFGLAKALDPAPDGIDASQSPTITSPAVTRQGVVLGTAAYMSPEQARGHSADRRSDIWAFGCVLYEMLTGRRAFDAPGMSDTIASVLRTDPDWTALPTGVPPSIRTLLRRCLEKDHKRRLHDIGDARLELDDAGTSAVPAGAGGTAVRRRERVAWLAVAALAVAFGALGARVLRPLPVAPELHLDVTTPPVSDPQALASVAISPDGRTLAFVADHEGQPHVWVRPLDADDQRVLTGTDNGSLPFWSPDARSIGFFANGQLKRIDLDGGLVRTLAKATRGVGGSWNRDGAILFGPTPDNPIWWISAEGGAVSQVTQLEGDQAGHSFPHFLPGGLRFLYYVAGSPESRGVYIGQLDGSVSRKLVDVDINVPVYSSGRLLFVRQGTLYGQLLNAENMTLEGTPVPTTAITAGATEGLGRFQYLGVSAGPGGTIAVRGTGSARRRLVWTDRSGTQVGTVDEPGSAGVLGGVHASADGRFVTYFGSEGGQSDVWLIDTRRPGRRRLTSHPGEDIFPVLSRDGSQVAFSSNRSGGLALYRTRTSGVGDDELLVSGESGEILMAAHWSPDDRLLLYQRRSAKTDWDLWTVPLEGDRTPRAILQTAFVEREGQISPDGRWLAYLSNSSGRYEVYVQPFPGPGGKVPASVAGGAQPRWGATGRELFYVTLDGRMMAVPIAPAADGQSVDVGAPVALFPAGLASVLNPVPGMDYDVSSDGRFLINRLIAPEGGTPPIRLLLNWKPGS